MKEEKLLLSSQICFPIYSVSRLLTKAYKPHLEELGITYPQYLVLMVLWENDKVSVNQITEKLLLNTNTMSPLLKRMEKMDLVNRTRSKEDERIVIVALTDKGRELKTKALPIPDRLFDEIVTDEIEIDDMLKLKDTLCELISVLTVKNEASVPSE
ncbi:MarR family transcriptional regulator [Lutimonas halocynthiae]|uniref:MarR family winged helix-turn-helix transcriptional regulator n=1 Tax=Lutimonas halocynthiae TaxID=1446477 RepID=UPI0025B566AF|nr:MarR family transcriptional regulator [Lutimonas halocynthiae]MDN3642016.1 MarR family transcriptional regulator [Lutimonas halocynthiae]